MFFFLHGIIIFIEGEGHGGNRVENVTIVMAGKTRTGLTDAGQSFGKKSKGMI